jgi:hypothetical protein
MICGNYIYKKLMTVGSILAKILIISMVIETSLFGIFTVFNYRSHLPL